MARTQEGASFVKISHAIAAAAAGVTAVVALQSGAQAQSAARAPAAAKPNWYVGAGLGRAEIPEGFSDSSIHDGRAYTDTGLKSEQGSTLAKGFIGFNLNRYFAIEGGYVNVGRFGAERIYTGPDGSLSLKWTSAGFNLDLVGILPIGDALSLQARLGFARLHSKGEVRSNGALLSTESSNKFAPHIGVGVQYDINRTFAIRGEYELFKKAMNSNFIAWNDGREMQYQAVSASGIVKF